jgi:LysM repeat protein
VPGADPQEGRSTIVRKWTMSACVALAWCLLALIAAAGTRGPDHPAQANTSTVTSISTTASISTVTSTSTAASVSTPGNVSTAGSTRAVLASQSVTAVNAEVTAAWTVRPGDTLSAIAAAFGIPGGWPALYAANRPLIGPDPGLIHPGTVLTVPGRQQPARYTVAPGDTLSAIAAALGVPGGWQALYAANRQVIGADPNVIRPGIVVAAPRPAARAGASPAAHREAQPTASAPARHPRASATAPTPAGSGHPAAPRHQVTAGSRPAGHPAALSHPAEPGHLAEPGHVTAPAGGMPRWLEDVLLAAGVLAATAFAAEPAAALARRRRQAARPAPSRAPGSARHAPGAVPGSVRHTQNGGHAAEKARIVLADHERLIVTYCARDHAVYVLTPPGEDPRAVLRAARLVLPEDTYEDLAGHLGVPSAWPLE